MRELLVRRTARKDLTQLVALTTLVAASTALGILGPGLVLGTLDAGAREAVAVAGSSADILATATVGEPGPGLAITSAKGMIELAETIPSNLPESIATVADGASLTVLSGETHVRTIDGDDWGGDGQLAITIAMLTDENTEALSLLGGRLPEARDGNSVAPVEVVISRSAADAAGVEVGQTLELGAPPRPRDDATVRPEPAVLVVGIVESDASDRAWIDSQELWVPFNRPATDTTDALTRVAVLARPDGVTAASRFLDYPFGGTVRIHVAPDRFSSELAASVTRDTNALIANGHSLAPASQVAVAVRSEIPVALAEYPVLARAALAQMSVVMSGVIGIAAVVLVLVSRLLVAQRAGAIALERARGASVVSVGIGSLIESVGVTIAGMTVAALCAFVSPVRDLLPIVVIAVVSLLASPVQAMAFAARLWVGQRAPANRRDRQLRDKRRAGQRLVAELAVVALAAAALVSMRGRGLLQNRTDGIDPLLALAPLLLAVAVTIVAIRIYPYPVRAVGAIAQRDPGALGLLGAVRARASVAVLPLLALTLGSALTVSGALLVESVHEGQDLASWQRVGADARVSAELTGDQVEALRAALGVDAVSATRNRGAVGIDLGTTKETLTVIAVDESYAAIVESLPWHPDASILRELAKHPMDGDRLSIVLDPTLAGQVVGDDVGMYYGPTSVDLTVIGETDFIPDGYVTGPVAYVDFDAVSALTEYEYPANSFLIAGPGADAAVQQLPPESVLSRTAWIDDRRGLALVAGVERTMLFAVIAVALLAIVALVATVVSGARARGRALSLLRTLGMRPRLGWWLALAELAPLVIAAVLGGVAAGVTVVVALAPSLGLDVLAGGTTVPTPSLSPLVIIGLAGAAIALLALGALADVLVHRRDKLSEVLRVGETV